MPVKILICAVTLAAMLISGCGEDKVIGTPDKAVLAYAETAMTGTSEHLSAAGFSADESNIIRQMMTQKFIGSMNDIVPLSEASAQELAKVYFDKLKGNVTLRATLKNDGDNPVVELTATSLDQGAALKSAGHNDEFIALLGMVGQLKVDGATDEQLKANPEVQKLAVNAIAKCINELTFLPERTFDVPCRKVTGQDGNMHWVPAAAEVLIDFLTGQK